MKFFRRIRIGIAALVLGTLCLGTGAAMAAAGGENDPLVTLSYLSQTVLPNLLKQSEEYTDDKAEELSKQFQTLVDEQAQQGGSASYVLVTLSSGQRLNLDLGSEVLLRIGSATAGAQENPALVDVTGGINLNHGGSLVTNHLYMTTMTDHYVVAESNTVKLLVRGGYQVS